MENKYFILLATDDYDNEKNALSSKYVKDIYDYSSYEEFKDGWYDILKMYEGDWYWIFHNGKIILSGAVDPQDDDYLFNQ